jgi:hypothetical protein
MERIKHTRTARLGTLKMYREDLDQLVELFNASCRQVIISDNDHRYDSLAEMKQHIGSKITNLDIQGENPRVHFLLNQREYMAAGPGTPSVPSIFNELRTEEISEAAESAFLRIRDFLSPYKRPSGMPFIFIGFVFAVLAVLGITQLFDRAHLEYKNTLLVATGIGSVIGAICIAVGFSTSNNMLLLETRANTPSFFRAHGVEFAKHAITALISSIVGAVIGYLAAHLQK